MRFKNVRCPLTLDLIRDKNFLSCASLSNFLTVLGQSLGSLWEVFRQILVSLWAVLLWICKVLCFLGLQLILN